MSLLLAEAKVSNVQDKNFEELLEQGESLVFPGETVEVLKKPIELPDSNAALKTLFLYKVKRKKEESDDEEEKKVVDSESESSESEEEDEEEEEEANESDES